MKEKTDGREIIFDNFRRWGFLQARLDTFDRLPPIALPALEAGGEPASEARRMYCGGIGAEFMHIPDEKRRDWISRRMESPPPRPERDHILGLLVRAEVFEQVLHTRFPGTKRFSLEGTASIIPLLDELLDRAGGKGAIESLIGMSHRGRLNVMVHIVGRPTEEIFTEFQDIDPYSVLGGGDVKYHIGATGTHTSRKGKFIEVRLVSNPSHLEAVAPVALGRTRAKQTRAGENGARKIFPILIHGDAAFAGQGIAAETMNLADIPGYSVGGTVHVIINNLIGFTARPHELHSSRFSSDVAKRLPIPIFHVNAEDPEAVVRAGQIALEYRYDFSSDVVVDLIGFRRHGHSEIDDPSITEPILYGKIKNHPPLWKSYSDEIGKDAVQLAGTIREEYVAALDRSTSTRRNPRLGSLPDYWTPFRGGPIDGGDPIETGADREVLSEVGNVLTTTPAGFTTHPKLNAILVKRADMVTGKIKVDFGMAELLAFGTLLRQGVPVRLSGQDTRRGTFGQRHAVCIDIATEKEYIPLQNIFPGQPLFEVYNTPLSELSVLGFEYGFSRDAPETLVLWEAQFGDFVNGAQLIIDQFISSAEDKWGLLSGLVLLLPHGYEGQGPEHSSARIERFLQIAAEDNIRICQPASASQYFHLLRRQALERLRKPLIVFTPKALLRHAEASSDLTDLISGTFQSVVTHPASGSVRRILICSGKIGYDLRRERERVHDTSTLIVQIEELYPFPEGRLRSVFDENSVAEEIIWVQEESANMGALNFVVPVITRLAGGRPVRSVKRSSSASPATGSARASEIEQKAILDIAFATTLP